MSLDHLTEQASQERSLKAKAAQALKEGRISQAEYEYLLRKELGASDTVRQDVHREYAERKGNEEHRKETLTKMAAVILLLAVAFGAIWALTGGEPTGNIVKEIDVPTELSFASSVSGFLNVSNTTTVRMTGTLTNGSGAVWLERGTGRLLVWEGSATPPRVSVTTAKASYALGESVETTITPASAAYTLWLTDEAGVKTLLGDGYVTTEPGSYVLDALVNDSGNVTKVSTTFLVRNDTNASNDVLRDPVISTLTFADACEETCEMEATGGSLSVELSDGATLTITRVTTAEERENNPPEILRPIPDLAIEERESRTINLNDHFTDPDGEELTYDYMNVAGVAMSVNGSTLTVTGISPGSGQSIIYASDLVELAQSQPFTITVTAAATGRNLL